MKKKEICVKTKRMIIQPMSDEEIENLIEASGSDELRTAYREMLSGSVSASTNTTSALPKAHCVMA